jgi:type I restriction enzyme M protein
LFLKMDDERARLVALGLIRGRGYTIAVGPVAQPAGRGIDAAAFWDPRKLPRRSGIVGTIFLKAQNEIQDPPKLRRLVGLIDGDLARPRRRREGIPNRSKRSTTPL